MSTFPTLKTGAVAQYPARKRLRYRTQVLRFVDGTEQRFRDEAHARRIWVIDLRLLDDSEASAIGEFVESRKGGYETFAFTDPWDGAVYPKCRLQQDESAMRHEDEARAATRIIIEESAGE